MQTMNAPDFGKMPVSKQLPDPFALAGGARVATRAAWLKHRETLKTKLLFNQYGNLPPAGVVVVKNSSAFTNNWGAREEKITLGCGPDQQLTFELNLLLPPLKNGEKSASFPLILTGDAGLTPIPAEVIARGTILVQFDRTQIAPDDAMRTRGIYALYPDSQSGTLAAWAWGYSRAVDYLLTRPDVDASRLAITGHSRGGKAVALAGALDERIALTAPHQSGSGGASPFRLPGKGSESLEKISGRFGYWFHPRLKTFVGHEERLPFDQHFLLALVAPRALLLSSALADPYSNSAAVQGSFLGAREVFEFLGAKSKIGSHYRAGGHSFGESDWRVLLDFADAQFFGRASNTNFDGLNFPDAPAPFLWRAPRM